MHATKNVPSITFYTEPFNYFVKNLFQQSFKVYQICDPKKKNSLYLVDFLGATGVLKWEGYFMSRQFNNKFVKKSQTKLIKVDLLSKNTSYGLKLHHHTWIDLPPDLQQFVQKGVSIGSLSLYD